MTGQTEADYTIRQAAYDLRKVRGKDLFDDLGIAAGTTRA